MRVLIINYSGNVGKSTIGRNLFAPRMPEAELISVESVNSDGQEDIILKGKRLTQLMQMIALTDDAIIDVGASNSEDFLWQMAQQEGCHEEFDLIVVPAINTAKQIADTIKTLDTLISLGVPASKIKVVFNNVDNDDILQDCFAPIYTHRAKTKGFAIVEDVIHSNELFPSLVKNKMALVDVLADETDYRALMRETSDPKKITALTEKQIIRRLAKGVNPKLQAVYEAVIA